MNAVTELEQHLLPDTKAHEKAPYIGFLNILLFCGTVFIFGFVSQHIDSLPIVQAPEAFMAQAKPLTMPDELAVLKEELESEFAPITDLRNFEVIANDQFLEIHFSTGDIFETGGADLGGLPQDMLGELARFVLPKVGGYMIEFEGHTDDLPMSSRVWKFPSNWELSTARAASILNVFVANGLRESSMRVSSRGKFEPKVPNRDEAGKPIQSNRLKNRRVVIRIGDSRV